MTLRQPGRFVAYLRVSTDGQGRPGLGLEAQRQAVAAYVAQAGGEGPFRSPAMRRVVDLAYKRQDFRKL